MNRQSNKQQTRPALLKRKRHVAEEVTEKSDDAGQLEQDRRRSRIETCAEDCGTRSSSSCSDSLTVSGCVEERAGSSQADTTTEMPRTSWSEYRHQSCLLTPSKERPIPLPLLAWADRRYVWDLMFRKDEMSVCERDEDMIQRHPHIEARMRSILLDWLVEVCEVYNLHRETYHLSMDYIDRFLSIQRNVQKQRLQLIGVTCLFIAAKVEEIYPPKISEFAFVTDGACTESEIMTMELSILKTLNWKLTPITANSWLNTFMQVSWSGKNRRRGVLKTQEEFLMPKYSGIAYAQTAQLIDLSILDIGCLQFSYSVIATSAIYHMFNRELALFVSGFEWGDISSCIQWMAPFATTVREASSTSIYRPVIEQSPGGARPALTLSPGEEYKLQVHNIDLSMLDAAQNRMRQATSVEASPVKETAVSPDVLTPPSSRKKTADEASVSMTESFV